MLAFLPGVNHLNRNQIKFAYAWSKSVSRILSPFRKTDGNHSSRLFVAKQLQRPTRKRRLIAQTRERATLLKRFPIWSCTARSLPSRACYHARCCALTTTFHPSPTRQRREFEISNCTHYMRAGWSVLCCTCRHSLKKESARTLSGSPPFGVRTFLSRKISGSDCPTCSNFARLV
jgi:hypothetical protein